jgi:RNA polymerase sigma-70 factor (ECF subfamily)
VEADGEVIQRSLGQTTAFADTFQRHFDRVEAYARQRVGSAAGEEIAAQTFLVAFERRGRFDTRYVSARPWLLGIATNLIRHHVRDERVHLAAVARAPIDPPSAPVDDPDSMDAERLRPQLAEALRTLSLDDRETFLLVALGELTYGQVAITLGIPIGTVRSRIHRARVALHERLEPFEATPEWTDPADEEPGGEQ